MSDKKEKGSAMYHPPKKNITNNTDIKSILLYSAKKNIANIIEEYSVLYPATSSASASVKSKGVLFVSANMEIKKIIAQGNSGKRYHPVRSCEMTIFVRFNDPVSKITGSIDNPIATSYEIICAAERNDPKNAYLELLAQPAMIIPYTLNEDTARINNTP